MKRYKSPIRIQASDSMILSCLSHGPIVLYPLSFEHLTTMAVTMTIHSIFIIKRTSLIRCKDHLNLVQSTHAGVTPRQERFASEEGTTACGLVSISSLAVVRRLVAEYFGIIDGHIDRSNTPCVPSVTRLGALLEPFTSKLILPSHAPSFHQISIPSSPQPKFDPLSTALSITLCFTTLKHRLR